MVNINISTRKDAKEQKIHVTINYALFQLPQNQSTSPLNGKYALIFHSIYFVRVS